MADESPVVKLVNAILLSAIKKRVEGIVIRAGDAELAMVELVTGGGIEEELRPPAQLLGAA